MKPARGDAANGAVALDFTKVDPGIQRPAAGVLKQRLTRLGLLQGETLMARRGWNPLTAYFLICLGSVLLPSSGCSAGAFRLVVDHKTTAVVVPPAGNLDANGRDLERMALNDFLDYVEKSTGARLAVTDGAEAVPADQPVVVLGFIGSEPKHAVMMPPRPLKRHAFYFEVSDRHMTILGADPRGLANGVHWFLRHKVGVRWYIPTELGEEVPKHASLTLMPEQTSVDPEFEWLRPVGNIGLLPEECDWGVRHGDDV